MTDAGTAMKQADGAAQEPVRLGVLGAGSFVSRRHLPEAVNNPHVQVAALCRRDADARAAMAAHFHVPSEQAYADWQEMLAKAELDAVLIATPNSLHYEMARAALEAGLHVLLEKPMTVRSEDAHELVALANERNLKLGVALNPPFWAHCHQIRRALKDEKMGALEARRNLLDGQRGICLRARAHADKWRGRRAANPVSRRPGTQRRRLFSGRRLASGFAIAVGNGICAPAACPP